MSSVCKACGAPIKWIKMASGKAMPVDAKPIPFRSDPKGGLTLVEEDGRVVRGMMDIESDKYGYTSHFATCPMASQFRKG